MNTPKPYRLEARDHTTDRRVWAIWYEQRGPAMAGFLITVKAMVARRMNPYRVVLVDERNHVGGA